MKWFYIVWTILSLTLTITLLMLSLGVLFGQQIFSSVPLIGTVGAMLGTITYPMMAVVMVFIGLGMGLGISGALLKGPSRRYNMFVRFILGIIPGDGGS